MGERERERETLHCHFQRSDLNMPFQFFLPLMNDCMRCHNQSRVNISQLVGCRARFDTKDTLEIHAKSTTTCAVKPTLTTTTIHIRFIVRIIGSLTNITSKFWSFITFNNFRGRVDFDDFLTYQQFFLGRISCGPKITLFFNSVPRDSVL